MNRSRKVKSMLVKGSLIRVLRGLFIAGELVNLLEYGDLEMGDILYTFNPMSKPCMRFIRVPGRLRRNEEARY